MIAATTPAEKTSKNTRPAAGTLKRRAHDLLEMEIGFISNPLFTETTAEAVVFEKDFDLDVAPEVHLKAGSKLPSHLARLCDAPLLDGDEEHHLFRRMNYCRFKANQLRSKLNLSRPSRTKLDEIDDLLSEADAVMHRIVAANVRLVISIVK